MNIDYNYVENPNPHPTRSREILAKYPEVRSYMGHYPLSALYLLLIVTGQMLIAGFLADQSYLLIIPVAYCVGAFANHALFVMVHEAAHDMISKNKNLNQIWGIICNIPQILPSSSAFRVYHILHHSYMGDYDLDADLAFTKEAKVVGRSTIMKALWFVAFLFVEAVRPARIKKGTLLNFWVIFNIVFIIATSTLIYIYMGPKAFMYLLLSNIFSVGLHPVGARWIQEHYTYKEGQQTYSYYGRLNKLSFNVGFHNEHHDFFRVPWIHLPKIRKIAPEYYDTLYYHESWSALILDFITNPNRHLFLRMVRQK